MKVRLARSLGFCFGVKRAINIAEEYKNTPTLGPLIHNKKEIDRLQDDFGVSVIESAEDALEESSVIVRTHGIERDKRELLKDRGVDIIDATCPYVTKPQKICEDMSAKGYQIVIFGDIEHPEVKGVMSYSKSKPIVVGSVDELVNMEFEQKVALVSQTTKKISNFLKIVDYLIRRCSEVRVFNTICNATSQNQDAARELAKEADIVIVVGGKNSSNTKQLLTICKEYTDAYLVEDESEIEEKWFKGKSLCGISAGASTPDWIISKIVKKIEGYQF
jgi:4-hydroxy-3-methylbut-2-enyl diphosphate reductase